MHQHFTCLVGEKRQKHSIKNNSKLLGTLILRTHLSNYVSIEISIFQWFENLSIVQIIIIIKRKPYILFNHWPQKAPGALAIALYISARIMWWNPFIQLCFQTSSTINSNAHTTKVGKLRKNIMKNIMKNTSVYKL